MKKLNYIIGFVTLVVLPSVYAQAFNPIGVLNNVTRTLYNFMQNAYSIYALTLILFFMLFYAIYASAATKISVFASENKLNKQGKILAGSLSGLTTLSIFYLTRGRGIQAVLSDVLSPFGVYGGLLLALLTFMIVYFGFRNELEGNAWKIALFFAGLMMVGVGMWLADPNIMAWGWLIAFIALLIFGIASIVGRLSGGGGDGGRDGDRDRGGDRGRDRGGDGRDDGDEGGDPRVPNVSNFRVVPGDGQITLTWDPVPGADSYQIKRYTPFYPQPGFFRGPFWRRQVWHRVRSIVAGNLGTFVDNNVQNDLNYCYKIRVIMRGRRGKYSAPQCAIPLGQPAVIRGRVINETIARPAIPRADYATQEPDAATLYGLPAALGTNSTAAGNIEIIVVAGPGGVAPRAGGTLVTEGNPHPDFLNGARNPNPYPVNTEGIFEIRADFAIRNAVLQAVNVGTITPVGTHIVGGLPHNPFGRPNTAINVNTSNTIISILQVPGTVPRVAEIIGRVVNVNAANAHFAGVPRNYAVSAPIIGDIFAAPANIGTNTATAPAAGNLRIALVNNTGNPKTDPAGNPIGTNTVNADGLFRIISPIDLVDVAVVAYVGNTPVGTHTDVALGALGVLSHDPFGRVEGAGPGSLVDLAVDNRIHVVLQVQGAVGPVRGTKINGRVVNRALAIRAHPAADHARQVPDAGTIYGITNIGTDVDIGGNPIHIRVRNVAGADHPDFLIAGTMTPQEFVVDAEGKFEITRQGNLVDVVLVAMTGAGAAVVPVGTHIAGPLSHNPFGRPARAIRLAAADPTAEITAIVQVEGAAYPPPSCHVEPRVHPPLRGNDVLTFDVVADVGIFNRALRGHEAIIRIIGRPPIPLIDISDGAPAAIWDRTDKRITVQYVIPAGTPRSNIMYRVNVDMI